MSAIEQLADNEREAIRESLEASALAHKARQEETLAAMDAAGQPVRTLSDDSARPPVTEIPAHIPRSQPEFATRAGALPAPEAPAATETPSAKAARARQMLEDGYAINDELKEALAIDQQFREAEADALIARQREIRQALATVAPELVEVTNAAVGSAEAYVEARGTYKAKRDQFDGILRLARAAGLPAADIPVIPPISIIGTQNTDAGYRVRKVNQALQSVSGW